MENIWPGEVSVTEGQILHDSTYMISKIVKLREADRRMGVARG